MKAIGGLLIILALAVGIVPALTSCESRGKAIALPNGKSIPMKCHWTGRAELVAAVPLLAVGAIMMPTRRRETLQALSVLGILIGAMVILLPTTLIGVCANPDMLCNMVMKPVLTFTGMLIILVGAAGFFLARRAESQ
ncbi:MAG: DUF4418 family protein [Anaerolineae bacterium]|nr:DUF4418 family protein [Anaerolineae bacterium]